MDKGNILVKSGPLAIVGTVEELKTFRRTVHGLEATGTTRYRCTVQAHVDTPDVVTKDDEGDAIHAVQDAVHELMAAIAAPEKEVREALALREILMRDPALYESALRLVAPLNGPQEVLL